MNSSQIDTIKKSVNGSINNDTLINIFSDTDCHNINIVANTDSPTTTCSMTPIINDVSNTINDALHPLNNVNNLLSSVSNIDNPPNVNLVNIFGTSAHISTLYFILFIVIIIIFLFLLSYYLSSSPSPSNNKHIDN